MKKTVIIIMTVLAVVIAITAYLNKDRAQEMAAKERSAVFLIKEKGVLIKELTLEDIKAAGYEKFTAVLKTSGSEPEDHDYEGVLLRELLKASGISLEGKELVAVSASDGYSIAYPVTEVLEDGKIYLVFAGDGELLKSREEGGRGPYQIIVTGDSFSNRRCKYALEADVR